jgi:23S rRNA pseudouridine2605 synthase
MAEGRKREVRRMFDAVGFPVRRLLRVRLGPIRLERLAPGKVRPLTPEEVRDLYRATKLEKAGMPRPQDKHAPKRQPGGSLQ